MATLAELVVKVRTDANQAVAGVDRLGQRFQRLGRGLSVGVTLPLVAAGKAAIDAGEQLSTVRGVTEQVIQQTGGAANVTAGQVNELTKSLEQQVAIDDKLIQEGSNIVLTFKNIRNEVGEGNRIFDRANETLLDIAAVTGTSVTSAATQLGKALDDPIKGVTALRRVGVSFTEQQLEQIKAMVESGDQLSAQRLILDELETQYGGAAEASADASDRIRIAFGNVAEKLGTALLPIVERASQLFDRWSERVGELNDEQVDLILKIAGIAAAAGPLLIVVGSLFRTISAGITIVKALTVALAFLAANPVVLIIGLIAALAVGLVVAYRESETFRRIVDGVFRAVGRVVGGFVVFALDKFQTLLDFWIGVLDGILSAAIRVFSLIAPNVADKLRNAQSKVRDFRTDANRELDRVKKSVTTTFLADTKPAENRIDRLKKILGRFPTRFELSANFRGDGLGLPGTGQGSLMGISPTSAVGSAYTSLGRPGDVISGFRPGSRTLSGGLSYHARGRALDTTPILGLAHMIRARFGSRTRELITPWPGLNLLNGRPHIYSDAVQAQHDGRTNVRHIHWAMRHGAAFLRRTVLHGPISIAENHPEVVAPEPMLRGILREELADVGSRGQRIVIDVTGTDEEMKRLIRKLFRTSGLEVAAL